MPEPGQCPHLVNGRIYEVLREGVDQCPIKGATGGRFDMRRPLMRRVEVRRDPKPLLSQPFDGA